MQKLKKKPFREDASPSDRNPRVLTTLQLVLKREVRVSCTDTASKCQVTGAENARLPRRRQSQQTSGVVEWPRVGRDVTAGSRRVGIGVRRLYWRVKGQGRDCEATFGMWVSKKAVGWTGGV